MLDAPKRRLTYARWMGVVFCLGIIGLGDLWAQSGIRKIMEKRSMPDRLATQVIDKAYNFSSQEMRLIDTRSVMNASGETRLSRRSEWSGTQLGQLTTRSEYSPANMQMIQKRSEPDATFLVQVQRYATPDARLRQKDQVIDVLFLKAAQKQSEMNAEEKRRLNKASDHSTIVSELQRNSVAAASYSRLLSNRSIPEATWQRLLRNRSVD
ncbi:MAG: hypothetical protein ACO36I_10355 [Candidatus Latescibacterota bacterium]